MSKTKKYTQKPIGTIWIATFHNEDQISFRKENSSTRRAGFLTKKSFDKIVNGEIGRESDFEEIIKTNNHD